MPKGLLLLTLLLIVGTSPVSAQDRDAPLLRMLSRVPDSVAARESLSYIDYDALIRARPGVPAVDSRDELSAILGAGGYESELLMSALAGIQGGPQSVARSFRQPGAMQEVVGFDRFDIARAAEFGTPPAQVAVLEGSFDTDLILAAHESRGYTQGAVGKLTLLCPSDGCESGFQQNLRDRDLANPFGGELGRSQPVLLGERLVASSTDVEALNNLARAIAEQAASLSDQPDYRAAAEAISTLGTVLQVLFITPLEIASASEVLIGPNLTPEQIAAMMAELEENVAPLPQSNLVALAHTVNGDKQQAVVVLVYGSVGNAKTAAEVVPLRLRDHNSAATNLPFMEVLADRGVNSVEASIHASTTARATVLITLSSPLPGTDPPEGEPRLLSMGLAYAALVEAYFQRDLGWLATRL